MWIAKTRSDMKSAKHEERKGPRAIFRALRALRPLMFFVASRSEPLRRIAVVLCDILYGATVYEMVRDLRKERAQLEYLFILVVFGDLLGVPVLPPYYTLRLLPYVLPNITGWRHSMLREKDLTDLCDQEVT